MAKLVAAGYVEETKQFVECKQLTRYRFSALGITTELRDNPWHCRGCSHVLGLRASRAAAR
jgi:hypothetical protein